MKIPIYKPEQIAKWTVDELKRVRERALKQSATDIVALCDTELSSRKPIRSPSSTNARDKGPVIGYHLLCRPEEKGVERNPDGTIWSGTWVIAEKEAHKSLEMGAYVALHASQAEASYFHGIIKGYRRSKREDQYAEGQKVKIDTGTDFLLAPTNNSVEWRGPGTVERSYVRAPKSQTNG